MQLEKIPGHNAFSMKLEMVDSVERDIWDASVASLGGTIFHMSIWADYIRARNPAAVPQFFKLFRSDGSLAGCALGFRESSHHIIMRPLTKSLWFDSAPLTAYDDDARHAFIRLIYEHAKQHGYVNLSIGSFASESGDKIMEKLCFDVTRRLEFLIQLDPSEDSLWAALGGKRRNSVKRALKRNVVIEPLDGERGLKELRKLQNESADRILERGGPHLSAGKQKGSDPLNVLQSAGVAQVLGAKVNGDIVSAGFFLYANKYVYYMSSGHNGMGLKANAPSLLLWEGIRHYRKRGAIFFNLGGCSADAVTKDSSEHGVYVFKREFNGKKMECTSGIKILNKRRYNISNQLRSFLEKPFS